MYIRLLIRKYLLRKIAPMFATLAVALCTAMVIIVLSVMGGFYDLMQTSARSLLGDVIVTRGLSGFPYERLLEDIRQAPEVQAATPIVRTFGLLQLHGRISMVQVDGIDPESFNQVTGFGDAIQWRSSHVLDYLNEWITDMGVSFGEPSSNDRLASIIRFFEETELFDYGREIRVPEIWLDPDDEGGAAGSGMVLGIAISPTNFRNEQGQYDFNLDTLGQPVTLTVAPLTRAGEIANIQSVRRFTVVNEYKSGLMDADRQQIYVPFRTLQDMIQFGEWDFFPDGEDPITLEPIGEPVRMPARATVIMVRGQEGLAAEVLRDRIENLIRQSPDFAQSMMQPRVMTWREQHAGLLNAVERERGLLAILFGIISLVAAAMIGVIFYMIAMEKTRDIGTLRAIGAGRAGIAAIFLNYGLVLGVIGSAMGVLLAMLVVNNINEIQELLVVLGFQRVWDPQFYYFDRIPSRLDPQEVLVIVGCAVAASVLAAVIPALIAASVDPVKSLRYE